MEAASDPEDKPGGLRLFIACEHPGDRLLLVQLLHHLGHAVELPELRDGLFRFPPFDRQDIVLCDTDTAAGETALRDFAVAPARPSLIALASGMSAERARRLRQEGADATLAKPVTDLDSLKSLLNRLSGARATPDADATEVMPEAMRESIRRELAGLLDLAGPMYSGELIVQIGLDLERLEAGLRAALAERDLAQIRTETHILISLSGTTGADWLKEVAERMNRAAHGADEPTLAALAQQVEAGLAMLRAEVRRVAAQLPDGPAQ